MFKRFKRNIIKMFREIIVYHSKSLEYRAKILTLMVGISGEINECSDKLLKEVATEIYGDDDIRVNLLIDTVYEYFNKIKTKNGLDIEHLILLINKESKENRRFTKKINMERLHKFGKCITDEDDHIYHERVLEFLKTLKEEYGTV